MSYDRQPLEDYQLLITDSELLAYLYGIAPDQRDRYILTALRIGFLTLSESRGDVNRQVMMDMAAQLDHSFQSQQQALLSHFQSLGCDDGPFQQQIQRGTEQIQRLFSPEEKNSIYGQIQQLLQQSLTELNQQWSLDEGNSAFHRLQQLLAVHSQGVAEQVQKNFTQLTQLLTEQVVRKQEAERGTRHGQVFEQVLNEQLAALCTSQGHLMEATGEIPGLIKNCKVGDAVIALSPEHYAAGARIVVEAKKSKSYTLKKALEELAVGRKNRDAEVGIFVISADRAPESWPAFQRFDHDIVVVWDAEEASSDIYLQAALSVAMAICHKRQYQAAQLPDFVPMLQAVVDLEKALNGLDEIHKLCSTIQNNSDKILKRCELMADESKRKLGDLQRGLEQLQRLDIALFDEG